MSKGLFKTAGLIAIVTIFCKIFGFARDVVIAKYYGATLISDAYFYAYQIIALSLILLGGLGGPFHTATVATFSKWIPNIKEKPPEVVQKTLYSFLTATALGFVALSVLLFFFSEEIINIVASGAVQELRDIASIHLKIMSPILFIGGVIGIFYGIANVYKEFVITSLSSSMLSIAIIIALVGFKGDNTGVLIAWASLIGAGLQLLIQLPIFLRSGFALNFDFDFKTSEMKKIGEILFPAMLGTTIGQLNIYIDMFFASSLEEGAWSAIGYANRIFQFPVGIMITAMLVPLFPMFSSFVGKQDWNSLKKYFEQGLTSLWYIAFPILAFIVLFAQDGVRMLFERGAFDANDTILVSEALIFLSLSIIPYMARDTITRIFYSFDDSRTPFYIAIFSIFIKGIMNYILVGPFGVGGITLSTTIVTLINAVLLGALIKDKINLNFGKLIKPLTKIAIASVFMGSFAYGLNHLLIMMLPQTTFFLFIKLFIIGTVSLFVYYIFGLLIKIESARQFRSKLRQLKLKI